MSFHLINATLEFTSRMDQIVLNISTDFQVLVLMQLLNLTFMNSEFQQNQ